MADSEKLDEGEGYFNRFTGHLAHGLKNRLAPAITCIQLLNESEAGDPVRVKRMLTLAWQSLQATQAALESLEKASEIKPGAIESVLVEDWLRTMASECEVELVSLKLETSHRLKLDKTLWTHALLPLLENVAVHADSRCEIQVVGPIADKLSITVRDWGPGLGTILPERAMNVLRRREGAPGAGFGLPMSEYAALLLGGTTTATGAPDGGLLVKVQGRLHT